MSERVEIVKRNGGISAKPVVFLGRDRFAAYLTATKSVGGRFDAASRSQVFPVAACASLVSALTTASFDVTVSPEVAADLQAAADSARGARAEAVERRLVVEVEMAKRGLSLFAFQRTGVEWLAARKDALLADEMGCVEGDAVVHANRAGKGFKVTLRRLFLMQNGGKSHGRAWDLSISTTVRSLCGGELHQHQIVKVLSKGMREVVRVVLASGKSIRLTPDHEVKTPNGWALAGALVPGQTVLTNGEWVDKDGYVRVGGLRGKHPRYTTGGVYKHILVMEKKVGRHVRSDEVVHHKNGNGRDNRIENLELLPSSSVHAAKHGREGGYARMNGGTAGRGGEIWFLPVEDRVVSVEPAGKTDVYDIACADPHRNFVANGIIVHNCGKTVQCLVALPSHPRVLVVGPVSAKGVWAREVRRWRPDITKVTIVGSFAKRLAKQYDAEVVSVMRWPSEGEIVIVNYDSLSRLDDETDAPAQAWLASVPSGVNVVVDEAHAIKSRKALRTIRTRAVLDAASKKGGNRWLVTGSPDLNDPREMWNLLDAVGLSKVAFGSWPRFISMYGGYKDEWGGWHWGPPSAEVAECLRKVMLRRMQEDVLPDLPPIIEDDATGVEIDADTRRLADDLLQMLADAGVSLDEAVETASDGAHPAEADAEARDDFRYDLDHGDERRRPAKRRISFTAISRVRAALATAKIPALLDLVKEYEENGEPVVVFSCHRAPVDLLGKREGWATITGDTPAAKRSEIEAAFQRGDLKGVAATIRAGGVAITLTRSHHMVFVDQDWTPELNRQATYRCKRIGQTSPVTVRRLIADHLMDERVAEILAGKSALIDSTVNAAAQRGDLQTVLTEAEKAADAVRVAQPTNGAAGAATGLPAPSPAARRGPGNPLECWAADGLLRVAGMDSDRALVQNGVGFSRLDGDFGHSLADQYGRSGALSDRQWAAAIRLARKYARQIGPEPTWVPSA